MKKVMKFMKMNSLLMILMSKIEDYENYFQKILKINFEKIIYK